MSPGAALHQEAGERAAAVDHAAEVDLEHPVELLCGGVQKGTRHSDTGVVDDDVGNTVVRANLVGESLDGLGVGNVEGVDMRRPADMGDLGCGRVGRGPVDVADHDLGTAGREGLGRFAPDPATRAGHDDQGVPEGFAHATDLGPQQSTRRRGALEVIDQFSHRGGDHLRMRQRRPVTGPDIAAPQLCRPARGVVVDIVIDIVIDIGPHELVLGVDQ